MTRVPCTRSVLAALSVLFMTLRPGIVDAQTSGLGGDGFTRVLWRGTDSSVSLWRLDSNLDPQLNRNYGPFPGYAPIALTVASNNIAYLLWRHTNGSISLWRLDASLNVLNSQVYGPYDGWTAQGLSVGGGQVRIIWRYTSGHVSVWGVDGTSLANISSKVYGPYFGWDPGAP